MLTSFGRFHSDPNSRSLHANHQMRPESYKVAISKGEAGIQTREDTILTHQVRCWGRSKSYQIILECKACFSLPTPYQADGLQQATGTVTGTHTDSHFTMDCTLNWDYTDKNKYQLNTLKQCSVSRCHVDD